jgi:hypothetical protein
MLIDALVISNKMKQPGTPKQAEAQASLFAELIGSELATKRDLSEIDAGLKQSIKELDFKISQVEANLRRDIKELELSVGETLTESQRQMLLGGLAIAGIIIAALGFLFRFLGHP